MNRKSFIKNIISSMGYLIPAGLLMQQSNNAEEFTTQKIYTIKDKKDGETIIAMSDSIWEINSGEFEDCFKPIGKRIDMKHIRNAINNQNKNI